MKGIFLDCHGVNPGDLSWQPLQSLMEFAFREHTLTEDIVGAIGNREVVLVDSLKLGREVIERCKNLKFIGIAATGTDNIDLEAAGQLGIAVTNVPAYSTDAVAQHAVALMLAITNRVEDLSRKVKSGIWGDAPVVLLSGKSLGIVGCGNIGKRTGQICEALGMKINVYSREPEATMKSDIVSLHCPLTDQNRGFVNEEFIGNMKDGAILINTARGGLLHETAVANALKSGKLAAAGLDVLATEPPESLSPSPLLELSNAYITPHIAFTPVETRQKIIDICASNIQAYINGDLVNRVDIRP